MSRMKTLFKYVIWIVLFFIFSEIMININLETSYKNIGRKDNLSQVLIYEAEATKVNGRIKGKLIKDEANEMHEKYLKVDFYSERDNLLGTKYIDVLDTNKEQNLELYFKLQDVEYYEFSFTNDKEEKEISLLQGDLNKGEIILATILALMVI